MIIIDSAKHKCQTGKLFYHSFTIEEELFGGLKAFPDTGEDGETKILLSWENKIRVGLST